MASLNSINNLQILPHPEYLNYGNTSSKKVIKHVIDRHELRTKITRMGQGPYVEDRVALVNSTFSMEEEPITFLTPLREDITAQNRSLNYNIVRDTVIKSCCIELT